MSYQEYLKQHYKQVRKRMMQNAIPEKKPLPAPMPESVSPPKGGLVSEKADKKIVTEALTVVTPVNTQEALRLADELMNSPRLPPLPGLALHETGAVRWMRILHAVARKHEIDADEILGRSRRRAVIDARFEVFYRLRVELAFSYLKIAHLMRKDHSTIMHGVNKLRKKLLDEKRGVADDESFLMDNRHQDGVGGELAVAG
jgi:hypothetical protein